MSSRPLPNPVAPVLHATLLLSVLVLAGGCGDKPDGTTDHPLTRLLACVPAPSQEKDLEQLGHLTYVDVRRSEAVSGITKPLTWAAFSALDRAGREAWNKAIDRLRVSEPSYFSESLRDAEQMPSTVGFDFFDVDQILSYGSAGSGAQLLAGSFSRDAIIAAFKARGYRASAAADRAALLFRHADERDDQTSNFDFDETSANPFGGRSGRRHPVALLTPRLLVSSPGEATTRALILTHARRTPSLLSVRAYRATTDALLRSSVAPAQLVQAIYLRPESLPAAVEVVVNIMYEPWANPNVIKEKRAELSDDLPLPPYRLAAMADGQDNGEQITLVSVAYDSAAQADLARPTIERRLDRFRDVFREGGETALSEVGGRRGQSVIHHANGMAVLVVPVRYPASPKVGAGRLYLRWLGAIDQSTFLPLVPSEGK